MNGVNLEEFKEIPNYSRYLISESGDIYDTETQRILVPNINGGYKCLNLYRDDGKKVLEKVHRCVAYTYLVKPENSTNNLLHKTEDRLNNHVSNLGWKVKGVTHPMYKRFSNYHGVKYHLAELEEICSKSGLPLWTVRSRLENGYTVEEIYQGYKNSDVYWVDGVMFVGEMAVRRYEEEKARKLRVDALKRKQEEAEKLRLEEKERLRIITEKRGTEDSTIYNEARDRWRGMMDRCYNPAIACYKYWGGEGATVCEEWHDPDVFCNWYVQNKITGWDLEKDILKTNLMSVEKQYSPENCCFVPKYLNQWFACTKAIPKIRYNKGYVSMSLTLKRYDGRKKITLTASNIEDLKDQYFLVKDLHIERHLVTMRKEWDTILEEYPNSPEIHPALISILENFSTEEYLKSKNI